MSNRAVFDAIEAADVYGYLVPGDQRQPPGGAGPSPPVTVESPLGDAPPHDASMSLLRTLAGADLPLADFAAAVHAVLTARRGVVDTSSHAYEEVTRIGRVADAELDAAGAGCGRGADAAATATARRVRCVLDELWAHGGAAPFRHPVSDHRAPRYSTVVPRPMCLADMYRKARLGLYGQPGEPHRHQVAREEVTNDLMAMVDACAKYNGAASSFVQKAQAVKAAASAKVWRSVRAPDDDDPSLAQAEVPACFATAVTPPPPPPPPPPAKPAKVATKTLSLRLSAGSPPDPATLSPAPVASRMSLRLRKTVPPAADVAAAATAACAAALDAHIPASKPAAKEERKQKGKTVSGGASPIEKNAATAASADKPARASRGGNKGAGGAVKPPPDTAALLAEMERLKTENAMQAQLNAAQAQALKLQEQLFARAAGQAPQAKAARKPAAKAAPAARRKSGAKRGRRASSVSSSSPSSSTGSDSASDSDTPLMKTRAMRPAARRAFKAQMGRTADGSDDDDSEQLLGKATPRVPPDHSAAASDEGARAAVAEARRLHADLAPRLSELKMQCAAAGGGAAFVGHAGVDQAIFDLNVNRERLENICK
jgi:hypothetical protein